MFVVISYFCCCQGLAVLCFVVGGAVVGVWLENKYKDKDFTYSAPDVSSLGKVEPDFRDVDFDDFDDDEQPRELENGLYRSDVPDVAVDGFGRHGDFWLVGHGEKTSDGCGKWNTSKLFGCLRVDKHDFVDLSGRNFKGKVYVRRAPHQCDKPECPVCYKDGWAVREAHRIEDRLGAVPKGLGDVEHIVHSIPVSDYGLGLKQLRKRAVKNLGGLGVIGGVLIFHAFRYRKLKGWFFSPHWHVLGFIVGGFGRCRRCPVRHSCKADCDGFYQRAWQHYQKTKYYTKVMGERQTVGGTAWYQLNHSSYSLSEKGKRNNIASWFGVCSYRKLKFTPELKKKFCPLCHEELQPIKYRGELALYHMEGEGKRRHDLFLDFEEGGKVVWELRKIRRKKLIDKSDYFDFSKEACDKWQEYLIAEKEREGGAFYQHCAVCGQPIIDVREQRMLDGGRPVHERCVAVVSKVD